MCKDHHLLPHYSEFLTPEEQEAMNEFCAKVAAYERRILIAETFPFSTIHPWDRNEFEDDRSPQDEFERFFANFIGVALTQAKKELDESQDVLRQFGSFTIPGYFCIKLSYHSEIYPVHIHPRPWKITKGPTEVKVIYLKLNQEQIDYIKLPKQSEDVELAFIEDFTPITIG